MIWPLSISLFSWLFAVSLVIIATWISCSNKALCTLNCAYKKAQILSIKERNIQYDIYSLLRPISLFLTLIERLILLVKILFVIVASFERNLNHFYDIVFAIDIVLYHVLYRIAMSLRRFWLIKDLYTYRKTCKGSVSVAGTGGQ